MTPPVAQGSIRRRLLLLLLLVSAAMAVLLYFVVQSVAQQVAQDSQDNILAASARSVMDGARSVEGSISVDLPYSALSMLDSVTDERVFYAVWLGPEFLTGYRDLPRPPLRDQSTMAFASREFLGEQVRIVSVGRPFAVHEGQVLVEVSVAQTLSGQRQTLTEISHMALAIGAGFFAISAILALLVARSTIRPLDLLTASVARRGPKDLRPVSAPVPHEMVPLVASLNTLMQRLEASLARSEDFIAEAAHRVRTPLAIVRTKAEIIQRSVTKAENRAALREMIHAIDDSSRTAGQLLDHAMVAFRLDNLAQETIDLSALVQDSVERLRPISEIKDITLMVTASDAATIKGDSILLQSALHNLLDNAVKYSPAGSRVEVALRCGDFGPRIDVRDTGAGFADLDLERLTGRFERGTNSSGIVGSGLGLTIAKDVIEAHGGQLRIGNNPKGGACASLLFPWS
ncbi:sensor histidine kinase [Meridianimarinicoccus aquatilis]|nr:sensor histidine kinase [Fluviibacterium aquatile]